MCRPVTRADGGRGESQTDSWPGPTGSRRTSVVAVPDLLYDLPGDQQADRADRGHAGRRLQEPLHGVPALGLEPVRARPVGQLVERGGQRLAGGIDLELDLSWVASRRHGDSLPDDPKVSSPANLRDTREGSS